MLSEWKEEDSVYLTQLVSVTLTKIISENLEREAQKQPQAFSLSPTSVSVPLSDPFLSFRSAYAPDISLSLYLTRLVKYSKCSPACLILTLIYLDRLIGGQERLVLTPLNVHRLVLVSLLVSVKYHDDVFYQNAYFSKLGGLPLSELNALEVDFLMKLDFSLSAPLPLYTQYVQQLVTYHWSLAAPTPVPSPSFCLSLCPPQQTVPPLSSVHLAAPLAVPLSAPALSLSPVLPLSSANTINRESSGLALYPQHPLHTQQQGVAFGGTGLSLSLYDPPYHHPQQHTEVRGSAALYAPPPLFSERESSLSSCMSLSLSAPVSSQSRYADGYRLFEADDDLSLSSSVSLSRQSTSSLASLSVSSMNNTYQTTARFSPLSLSLSVSLSPPPPPPAVSLSLSQSQSRPPLLREKENSLSLSLSRFGPVGPPPPLPLSHPPQLFRGETLLFQDSFRPRVLAPPPPLVSLSRDSRVF